MGEGAVLDLAQAEVQTACAALQQLQKLQLWRIPQLDLLSLAQSIEGMTRLGFGVQVRVAGEIDHQRTADQFESVSTVALLRETLTISQADARTRVSTAKMIYPQLQPSGATANPILPELAAAITDGLIWVETLRCPRESFGTRPGHGRETRQRTPATGST